MKFVVRSTKEPYMYVVSKNQITQVESKARWFDFDTAHKTKRFYNKATNPKTLWEVVRV